MRRLAIVVIAVSMLPAFGAAPDEPDFSLSLPSTVDLTLPGFSGRSAFSPRKVRPAVGRSAAGSGSIRVPDSKCYYMGQVNKALQKPKDKPELVQLAEAVASSSPGENVNCLTTSLEPLPPGR